MILESASPMALSESYEENPFLGWPAFGVEIGGGIAGWAFKKRSRNLFGTAAKQFDLAEKFGKARSRMPGTLKSHPAFVKRFGGHSLAKQKKVKARELKALRKGSRAYSSAGRLGKVGRSLTGSAKFLAVGSLFTLGYEMANGLFDIADSFAEGRASLNQSMVSSYQDTSYYDSRRAMTQRQRAIQAIHSSQLSTRVAFGNEASYLHA